MIRLFRVFTFGMSLSTLLLFPKTSFSQDSNWQELAKGLELGKFKVTKESPVGDSTITILRIDPSLWDLKLLSMKATDEQQSLTAKQWSEKYELVTVINAGMFGTDYISHVGYMKSGDQLNSSVVNKYQSIAAFTPLRSNIPPFRIFDLDEMSVDSVIQDYQNVIQNLRLIKRPRENRWSQQSKKWSEVALGEDNQGRPLFIYSRSPYSMHDFNEILLSLPIGLTCAQHLEGGPEAQLYLNIDSTEIELIGSYETHFYESNNNQHAWPIPNVIGVVRKED